MNIFRGILRHSRCGRRHRDDGKRFVVHADEKLTAFLGLELVIRLAANCLKLTMSGVKVDGSRRCPLPLEV